MVWDSVWLSRKNERFWWGSWVFSHSPPFVMFSKSPHFGEKMWWEEGVLWEITYQPPSLPTYVCVDFIYLFIYRIRICYKISCSNSCKMHMYQVTIWWKIQSWYESFHLNISLDQGRNQDLELGGAEV